MYYLCTFGLSNNSRRILFITPTFLYRSRIDDTYEEQYERISRHCKRGIAWEPIVCGLFLAFRWSCDREETAPTRLRQINPELNRLNVGHWVLLKAPVKYFPSLYPSCAAGFDGPLG
jgi:hypothetical protein